MKINRFILILLLLYFQPVFGHSQSVRLINKIPIDENVLMLTGSFVVFEDGNFLFADLKDKNNQFKLINEAGKLIKAWGKAGPGPDEYGGIAIVDYSSKYLAAYDAGRQRIHIFEISKDSFQKKHEILAWETNSFIKLYNQGVLIEGYIVSPENKKYTLFKRDFSGKKTEYILPLMYRYGGKSMGEYNKTKEEVEGVSRLGFADLYEDFLFYVSDVRLKIIKIDLNTMKIDIFGQRPENFSPLTMDRKTRENLLQIKVGREIMEKILGKYSFVTGIFADKNFLGVIYVNREKKIQNEKYFVPYYQIYDHSGKLLKEDLIEGYYTMENLTPLFYQKDKGNLFLLSTISGDSGIGYTIYKYEIRFDH